jgi:hypothetical protein
VVGALDLDAENRPLPLGGAAAARPGFHDLDRAIRINVLVTRPGPVEPGQDA